MCYVNAATQTPNHPTARSVYSPTERATLLEGVRLRNLRGPDTSI